MFNLGFILLGDGLEALLDIALDNDGRLAGERDGVGRLGRAAGFDPPVRPMVGRDGDLFGVLAAPPREAAPRLL